MPNPLLDVATLEFRAFNDLESKEGHFVMRTLLDIMNGELWRYEIIEVRGGLIPHYMQIGNSNHAEIYWHEPKGEFAGPVI